MLSLKTGIIPFLQSQDEQFINKTRVIRLNFGKEFKRT